MLDPAKKETAELANAIEAKLKLMGSRPVANAKLLTQLESGLKTKYNKNFTASLT